MSIASEISRIKTGKSSLKSSLENLGATIPSNTPIEDYPSIIDNLPSGGSVYTDFDYENWISYGLTEPDPTEYKYWFPINTTPQQTPIKYVSNYLAQECFSGEFGESLGTPITTYPTDYNNKISSATNFGALMYDYTNNYFMGPTQNAVPSPTNTLHNIYKYTYSNQLCPMQETQDSSKCELIGNLSTILNLTGTIYSGCWTAYKNKIYGVFTPYRISYYDCSTGQKGTIGRFNDYLVDSSNKAFGLYPINDSTFIMLRTTSVTSSNVTVQAVKLDLTTNQATNLSSYSTIHGSGLGSQRINSDHVILARNVSSWQTSSSNDTIYVYNLNSDSFAKITPPASMSSRYLRVPFMIPWNQAMLTYSYPNSYTCYTLNNNSLQLLSIPEPSQSFINKVSDQYGSLLLFAYFDGTILRSNQLRSFTAYDSNNVGTTSNVANYGTTNIIELDVSKQYSITTDIIESSSSVNNVLLLSNTKQTIGYGTFTGYALYPRAVKDTFIWCERPDSSSNCPKCIYNKTAYSIKISDGTQWLTSDPDNVII